MSYKEMLIVARYCGICLIPLYPKYITNSEPRAVNVAGMSTLWLGAEWGVRTGWLQQGFV